MKEIFAEILTLKFLVINVILAMLIGIIANILTKYLSNQFPKITGFIQINIENIRDFSVVLAVLGFILLFIELFIFHNEPPRHIGLLGMMLSGVGLIVHGFCAMPLLRRWRRNEFLENIAILLLLIFYFIFGCFLILASIKVAPFL